MDEFDLITKYFRPLGKGFGGALNLADDAALIGIPDGHELVITTDAISAGIHFIGDEDARLIAKKLLRVNLSDLAAMGATPLCYFLAVMLPKDTAEEWIKRFAEGLVEDQADFHIHLAGGDTTATSGPASFAVTALGTVPQGKALKRSGAKPGDLIYVSETLGDAALGLEAARGTLPKKLSKTDQAFLLERYQLPQPRLALGQALRGIASACIDISDGLVQDMGHICETSGCMAIIDATKLPLSKAAHDTLELMPELGMKVFTGGDDYELLFTVSKKNELLVPNNCSCIGMISTKEGNGVIVFDDEGKPMHFPQQGYRHFQR